MRDESRESLLVQLAAISPKPLQGRTIVVTRALEQSAGLVDRMNGLGAEVVMFPVIRFADPDTFEPLDSAIARLNQFDWVIFTSANAVRAFRQRLDLAGKSVGIMTGLQVGAIGPATAEAAGASGFSPTLVPDRFVLEGLLEKLGKVQDLKFLIPCADLAREALVEGLRQGGAIVEQVTAYRTVPSSDIPGQISSGELLQRLEAGTIDMVSFTSSSTAQNFAARLASVSEKPLVDLLRKVAVACIGPITAATVRQLGLPVALVSTEFTTERMAEDIAGFFSVVGAGNKQ